jgi:hypothetical protein
MTTRRSLLIVAPHAPALRRALDLTDLSVMFSLFDSVDRALAAAQHVESAPS